MKVGQFIIRVPDLHSPSTSQTVLTILAKNFVLESGRWVFLPFCPFLLHSFTVLFNLARGSVDTLYGLTEAIPGHPGFTPFPRSVALGPGSGEPVSRGEECGN